MPFELTEIDGTQAIPAYPGKSCGACTACCYTVPVQVDGYQLVAPFARCRFLAPFGAVQHGCTIYSDRPKPCRHWACSWLSSDLPDEFRPDRCGFVVDPVPDLVAVNGVEQPAVQVWAIPGHEEDWRDPEGPMAQIIYGIARTLKVCVLVRFKRGDWVNARCFNWSEGKLNYSEETICGDELGPEEERLQRARAQRLWQKERAHPESTTIKNV